MCLHLPDFAVMHGDLLQDFCVLQLSPQHFVLIALTAFSAAPPVTTGKLDSQRPNTWVKRSPLPGAPVSPHLGYVNEDNYRALYADTVENVLAWLDGKPIRVLNP